jgi:hypothetical protein
MTQQNGTIEGLTPEAAAMAIKLAKGMANSKEVDDAVAFWNLAKKADPNVTVPVNVQMEQFRREQAEREAAKEIERRAAETKRRLEQQRSSLIETGRYTEETVQKIEKEIMETRGISDYDVAATLYAAQNPEPSVNTPAPRRTGTRWDMPWKGQNKEQFSNIVKDPRGVALERADAAMADIIRNRKRA